MIAIVEDELLEAALQLKRVKRYLMTRPIAGLSPAQFDNINDKWDAMGIVGNKESECMIAYWYA